MKVPANSDLSTFATLQEVADSSQLVQFHCHSLFGVYHSPSVKLRQNTLSRVQIPSQRWNSPDVPSYKTHQLSFFTWMNPCATGPRSNPMWIKVHSTFLVESGECWRSARTWAPNKVQTGLDNFLPETISNGLLESLHAEKWLLRQNINKFSWENMRSNPCAFKSDRKTEPKKADQSSSRKMVGKC